MRHANVLDWRGDLLFWGLTGFVGALNRRRFRHTGRWRVNGARLALKTTSWQDENVESSIVWERGVRAFTRMPTHAVRLHEWGTRGMGVGYVGPPAISQYQSACEAKRG
jgi:hypothetical protein